MKYLLGVIGIILVAVLAIVIIVSRVPGDQQAITKQGEEVVTLSELAEDGAKVVFTTQGRLVGDDQHRSIRISVDRNSRTLDIIRGYDGSVERTQSFQNTFAAYDTFIKALENAGYSRERKYETTDERGICPMGNRYVYEVTRDGQEESRLWSTSCAANQGTFAGNATIVRQLFQQQITDYSKLTETVRLY